MAIGVAAPWKVPRSAAASLLSAGDLPRVYASPFDSVPVTDVIWKELGRHGIGLWQGGSRTDGSPPRISRIDPVLHLPPPVSAGGKPTEGYGVHLDDREQPFDPVLIERLLGLGDRHPLINICLDKIIDAILNEGIQWWLVAEDGTKTLLTPSSDFVGAMEYYYAYIRNLIYSWAYCGVVAVTESVVAIAGGKLVVVPCVVPFRLIQFTTLIANSEIIRRAYRVVEPGAQGKSGSPVAFFYDANVRVFTFGTPTPLDDPYKPPSPLLRLLQEDETFSMLRGHGLVASLSRAIRPTVVYEAKGAFDSNLKAMTNEQAASLVQTAVYSDAPGVVDSGVSFWLRSAADKEYAISLAKSRIERHIGGPARGAAGGSADPERDEPISTFARDARGIARQATFRVPSGLQPAATAIAEMSVDMLAAREAFDNLIAQALGVPRSLLAEAEKVHTTAETSVLMRAFNDRIGRMKADISAHLTNTERTRRSTMAERIGARKRVARMAEYAQRFLNRLPLDAVDPASAVDFADGGGGDGPPLKRQKTSDGSAVVPSRDWKRRYEEYLQSLGLPPPVSTLERVARDRIDAEDEPRFSYAVVLPARAIDPEEAKLLVQMGVIKEPEARSRIAAYFRLDPQTVSTGPDPLSREMYTELARASYGVVPEEEEDGGAPAKKPKSKTKSASSAAASGK